MKHLPILLILLIFSCQKKDTLPQPKDFTGSYKYTATEGLLNYDVKIDLKQSGDKIQATVFDSTVNFLELDKYAFNRYGSEIKQDGKAIGLRIYEEHGKVHGLYYVVGEGANYGFVSELKKL